MRHFKTIKGFVNSSYLQVTIESIMSGRTTFCHNGTYKHENFKLSSDAIREIAKGFSEYLYSTKERANEVFGAFIHHRGDYSFFNFFTLNGAEILCAFLILFLERRLIIAVGNL